MRAFFSEADAVVIACPEYNRGMPRVLKNALDWLSRPPAPPLYGKCALLISTATGGIGGALSGAAGAVRHGGNRPAGPRGGASLCSGLLYTATQIAAGK